MNVGRPNDACSFAWTRTPITSARCNILFAPLEQSDLPGIEIRRSGNPRLAFAIAAAHAFPPPPPDIRIDPCAIIHPTATIGYEGFGHERRPDGSLQTFPHYGGVCVGPDVHIGPQSCVDRGSIGDTIICVGARIDNLVQIAHNVIIAPHVSIAAETVIEGSAYIGSHVTIGASVNVMFGRTVGSGATIGSGAVVTKDVPPGETWASPVAARRHVTRAERAAEWPL